MKFSWITIVALFVFLHTSAAVQIKATGICAGDTTFLSLSSTTGVDSAKWNFGDPSSGLADSMKAINGKHVYQSGGNFNVVVKYYIGGIAHTSDTLLTIIAAPVNYYLPQPYVDLCEGQSDTLVAGKPGNKYDWHGINDTTNSYIVSSAKVDTIYLWVTATNRCGQSDQFTRVVWHAKPTVDLGDDTILCHTNSIVLHLHRITDPSTFINWDSYPPDTDRTVRQSGTYAVTITNVYCGSVSDTIKITFEKAPKPVSLGSDTFFCQGTYIKWNVAQPGVNYLWQNGSTKPTDTIYKTTNVSVIVYNDCGADTAAVTARLVNLFLHIPHDTLLCYGNTLPLNIFIDSTTNYLWSDGSTGPSIIINQPGTYSAKVQNQCGTLTDTINVKVHSCRGCINIPEAFTPNDDGRNDIFHVLSNCEFTKFDFKVYDRWGQLIFESTDFNEGWDGKYKGKPMPVGSYTYVLQYATLDAGSAASGTTVGYVLLIR